MKFSTQFLLNNVHLKWSDVLWGYQHKLIGWRSVVEIAIARSNADPNCDARVFELSLLGNDEEWKAGDYLNELAQHDADPEEITAGKWLYLTLLQLYENRDQVVDPFEQIEEVWSDFGYPDEIRGFVRLLGPEDGYDPRGHTYDENMEHLRDNWRAYLDNCKREYSM